ncbi:hypothetical protein BDF20DRAFT_831338 [Mycotypha africana]|uniref:uncharacterized protein n=1 Tax=Mycotypha africana TaxID=64632 RepID=UPI0023013669|nr:uncharacterized protein BDF20DRAFT_831338 [Mycotypha africana]KAI8991281.1 hypothetical protein BDF20DRAFT_831338 [Mycotypha africana]
MGAKPSKSSDHRLSISFKNNNRRSDRSAPNNKRKSNFRAALSPTSNRKKKAPTTKATSVAAVELTNKLLNEGNQQLSLSSIQQQQQQHSSCITEDELISVGNNESTNHQASSPAEVMMFKDENKNYNLAKSSTSSYISMKRSSPSSSSLTYDLSKLKKSRRTKASSPSVIRANSTTVANNNTNHTHISVMSNYSSTTNPSDAGLYMNNKSNLSSGWTTLSNDPFSQIEVEADTSAFTEITDHSTISTRKSLLLPVIESSLLPPSYYDKFYNFEEKTPTISPELTAQNILTEIVSRQQQEGQQSHVIIGDVYKRIQRLNDPYSWSQFYQAIQQYVSSLTTSDADQNNKSVAIIYLAKCRISGLGVTTDIEGGLQLLTSHTSCETLYALGHCYSEGLPNGVLEINKTKAFSHFKQASEYDATINESIKSTVGEAQCSMAHMLFQGEGVTQNIEEAMKFLMKSAENDNMYAQFLIGAHYERGIDIAQDLELATYYYRKSAESGFPEAQAALGNRLISDNISTSPDFICGIEWLEKATQSGNSRAHVQLGILYDKGIENVLEQNDDIALLHYKAAAESKNPAAQYILGLVYYFGRLGKQKNHNEAVRLIKQSAMAGLPYAQRVLGQFYQQGVIVLSSSSSLTQQQQDKHQEEKQLNVTEQKVIVSDDNSEITLQQRAYQRIKRNEREAVRWYKRAAAGKDIVALGILGKCYELGTGVDVDLEKALALYAKATEMSNNPYVRNAQIDQALLLQRTGRHFEAFEIFSDVLNHCKNAVDETNCNENKIIQEPYNIAQLSVARYYLCRNIKGINYNPMLAHTMLCDLIQRDTNNAHAHYWLGSIYDEGIPGFFEIDRLKAFQHFKIAAEAGDNDATFLVAYMMSNYVIPLKGPADAFPWYLKAATRGHPMSMYSVGLCFYKGIGQENGVPQLETALGWFEKASRLGVAESNSYMARIYFQFMNLHYTNNESEQAQQQFVNAIQCLKKALDKQDTYAQRELGKIYLTGKGLEKDHGMAVDLLEKAAAKQDPEALTFLGDCYHKGTGVIKNLEKAVQLYLLAAELGYPYAYSATAELYFEIGKMDLAYNYYLLASKEQRIVHNRIGKTARMMVARIALKYSPHTQRLQQNTSMPQYNHANNDLHLFSESSNVISPQTAFNILHTLATREQFPQAFQPLALCYANGTGTEVNLTEATFWFRKSAEELQDSVAYYHLANLLLQPLIKGDRTADNEESLLALSYLRKSAELEYPEAQYQMGMIYLHGKYGICVDERVAANWFKSAASRSHAESCWMLSQLSALIHEDELEFQYQKQAAEMGHVLAMRVVGRKYLKQLEKSSQHHQQQLENLEQALKYLHMAGDAGDIESLVLLGKTYNSCTKTRVRFSASHISDKMRSLPTPGEAYDCSNSQPTPSSPESSKDDIIEESESRFQREEDEKNLAIQCFERASQLGDLDATVYAAEAWYEQKQYAAALEYFEKASQQGSTLARFFCARYLIEGYGGSELNPEKGFKELLICANELNCIHAFNTLAQCYENAIGTEKNDHLAYQWYLRAAETTHDAEAYYRIGQMFAHNRILLANTDQNKDLEAFRYYDLAVNATPSSHGPSCYELGMYYLNGIQNTASEGVVEEERLLDPDICLAIEYFKSAADLGVQKAMYQLGILFLNDDYTVEEQEEGLYQLQRAAELGLREAQFELGLYYHRGKEIALPTQSLHNVKHTDNIHDDSNKDDCMHEGNEEYIIVPQDFEKAFDLFCRAAVQRHPTAALYLGIYYQHGIFVAPDLAIALEQYEIAVQLFEDCPTAPDRWQAEFNMARILHQDIESQTRAYELFQAAHMHAPEQYKFLSKIMITRYHLHGLAGVTHQPHEAAATLIHFANEEEYGYRVYLDVAQCFEGGKGVEKNLAQAFYWYGEVINKVHQVLEEHQQLQQQLQQQQQVLPLTLMDEEIEENEAIAMFKLAEFYRNGIVVQQDIAKADDLYRLAARKGCHAAQEYLSMMLQSTTLHDD